ncbi:MAG: C-terminal binding protein [Chloroherpetonaceae bacterium]|nr:C-terminal binding protein [Chthonomonadaceae bacterium]MDW8206215.1 C-terminal binding protein [Chloroherpetonaceae bacterium]
MSALPELPRIVITDRATHFTNASREMLERSGVVFADAESAGEDPMHWIRNAEVLLVTWFPVTADVVAQLRRCRAIIRIGVGYDNVDTEAARARGIAVCNVPDYGTEEVADHAMALALSLSRGLPFLERSLRSGQWIPALPGPIAAFRTLCFGVLGCGRIGRATLERARAFRFQLLACDPYLPAEAFPAGVRACALDELLAWSDILSLHAPLTPETRHLINTRRLAQMKPTSILINTARGAIVDTHALVEALADRRIAAAGLDVFEEEPLPPDHPLLQSPRVLVTPHHAWYSTQSREALYRMAVEEALRAVHGVPLRSCVNGVQPNRASASAQER